MDFEIGEQEQIEENQESTLFEDELRKDLRLCSTMVSDQPKRKADRDREIPFEPDWIRGWW